MVAHYWLNPSCYTRDFAERMINKYTHVLYGDEPVLENNRHERLRMLAEAEVGRNMQTFMGLPVIFTEKLKDGIALISVSNEGTSEESWEVVRWDPMDGFYDRRTFTRNEIDAGKFYN